MQFVLVYLKPCRRNLLLKCVLQPKIWKKSLNISILKVQGRSRSLILMPIEKEYKTFY